MKIFHSFLMVLFSTVFLFSAVTSFAGKKIYDDFSTGYIDGNKWGQREYVREIVNGELVLKIGNRSPGMGAENPPGYFRTHLPFANPESIYSIECEITVVETQLDSATGSKSYIRIGGAFYNKNIEGGAIGNIFAQIMIGDQGNGKVEAFWEVRAPVKNNSTSCLSYGQSTALHPPTRIPICAGGCAL